MDKLWQKERFRLGVAVVLLAFCVLVFSPILPWWGFIPLAVGIGFFVDLGDRDSFLGGFLGGFVPFLLKMILINSANDGILADKMAATVNLPGAAILILCIALLGGILGGLGVWTGGLIRKLLQFRKA